MAKPSKFSEGLHNSASLTNRTIQYSCEDTRSDMNRAVSKKLIPVLPRKATPSNVRSKSTRPRNRIFSK